MKSFDTMRTPSQARTSLTTGIHPESAGGLLPYAQG
jgi:hypothetical protein